MEFKSITPHLGAEVTGIDLSKAMDAETFEALRTAWLKWGVLEWIGVYWSGFCCAGWDGSGMNTLAQQ